MAKLLQSCVTQVSPIQIVSGPQAFGPRPVELPEPDVPLLVPVLEAPDAELVPAVPNPVVLVDRQPAVAATSGSQHQPA